MSAKGPNSLTNEAADRDGEDDFGSCLTTLLDNGSVDSRRYYLARRTVLEMLKDRGFAVPSVDLDLPLQEFRNKHGQMPEVDNLTISALHRDDPSIKSPIRFRYRGFRFCGPHCVLCCLRSFCVTVLGCLGLFSRRLSEVQVLFCGPNIVKVNVVRAIAAKIYNSNLSRLILVVQNKMTNQALKALDLLSIKVEVFQITDLLVNITKHELRPKHQLLTNKEKQNLLKKYSINEKQLPRMLETDAIARYYGLEKGQVVKVTYTGDLTQLHVTYRCVW